MIFFTRPICLVIFAIVAVVLLLPVLPLISGMRKTIEEAGKG
jgi:uncharacterized membrane protein YjjP (DUF1212 family)